MRAFDVHSNPYSILASLERVGAGARITFGVSLARAIERRVGVGARLSLGGLHRTGRRLVMKLGFD